MIKDIQGYEGIYAVDDMGNVYSLKFGKMRKLKASDDGQGYLNILLWKDGKRKTCKVHRLIAKTFLSNYSDNLQVDHIDRDKANNKLSNLRMTTHSQNQWNNNGKGYTWDKTANKWKAQIVKDGKIKNLGRFDKEEEARAAYLAAKKIYHII